MDFDNYKIKLNVKAMCLFEQIAHKSYFDFVEDDTLLLMYASLVCNNHDLNITYEAFKTLLNDKKVLKWIVGKYEELAKFNQQLEAVGEMMTMSDNHDSFNMTMAELASILIVRYGMDPQYVMYDMDLWEMKYYLTQGDKDDRINYENERLWTYIGILPHVDGKKMKGPQSLIEFPWEKGNDKNKAQEDIDNNKDKIMRTFALMNKEKE